VISCLAGLVEEQRLHHLKKGFLNLAGLTCIYAIYCGREMSMTHSFLKNEKCMAITKESTNIWAGGLKIIALYLKSTLCLTINTLHFEA